MYSVFFLYFVVSNGCKLDIYCIYIPYFNCLCSLGEEQHVNILSSSASSKHREITHDVLDKTVGALLCLRGKYV